MSAINPRLYVRVHIGMYWYSEELNIPNSPDGDTSMLYGQYENRVVSLVVKYRSKGTWLAQVTPITVWKKTIKSKWFSEEEIDYDLLREAYAGKIAAIQERATKGYKSWMTFLASHDSDPTRRMALLAAIQIKPTI